MKGAERIRSAIHEEPEWFFQTDINLYDYSF